MIKFRYTILYVETVEASLAFYARAFGLEAGFLHEGKDYGELSTGETKLAFSSRTLMESLGKAPLKPDPDAPQFEIALETDDVEVAFARAVAAGAIPKRAPEAMPWGQVISYVTDPDGYLIEICSPVSPLAG